jgi:DNA repair exonuclease SbcCD ATPase subunit
MLRQRLEDSRLRLNSARVSAAAKSEAAEKFRQATYERAQADRRLAEVRLELERLRPSRDAAKALEREDAPAQGGDLAPTIRQAELDLEAARAIRARYQAAMQRAHDHNVMRNMAAPEVAARREALQVLGPAGAQRRLVDGLLIQVERSANEDLARAGVELRVAFSWQRELEGLAEACASCGQPFPSSRKVRACEACGAQRGRKLEQKLRIEVSPKSGGMDALAGVGVRLSTTAWLKARRGSSWSVACLDEPLAAVDAHNRALVGRHLVAMLGGHYGLEQSFISSHSPEVLSTLPRRIVVRATELGSTLEVL